MQNESLACKKEEAKRRIVREHEMRNSFHCYLTKVAHSLSAFGCSFIARQGEARQGSRSAASLRNMLAFDHEKLAKQKGYE